VSLLLAELLDHHLLGGLRGNAAETLERDELALAVGTIAPQRDLAGEPIDRAGELLGVEGVEVLARRADHRLLEIPDEDLAIDVLVAGDRIQDAEGFRV